jgi:hypothetical protein
MVRSLRFWAACGLASLLAASTALGDGKGDGKSIIIAQTETDSLLTSSRRTAQPSPAEGEEDAGKPKKAAPNAKPDSLKLVAAEVQQDDKPKTKSMKQEKEPAKWSVRSTEKAEKTSSPKKASPKKSPSSRVRKQSDLEPAEESLLYDETVKPVVLEEADWIAGACESLPVVGQPLFSMRKWLSDSSGPEGDGNDVCCERRFGGYGFAVVDGWKGRIDNDHNNNFGPRGGVNVGALAFNNIGGQLGVSYAGYDLHGRELDEERSAEDQLFITAGVFKRATCCCPGARWLDRISAGFVYDQMIADNLGDRADYLTIGQVRGRVGFVLDCRNELGVWGASGIEPRNLVRPGLITEGMDQISGFWHHKWQYCAETTFWAGVAEDPGQVTLGFQGEAPLNDRVSLFGSFHYILPSTSGGDTPNNAYAEEFWSVSFGVTVYLRGCGGSKNIAGHRWMPLLPVADNGSFALELPGG